VWQMQTRQTTESAQCYAAGTGYIIYYIPRAAGLADGSCGDNDLVVMS
jgi:hypothetical protein